MTITILLVTILSGPMDGAKFSVPFETMESCMDAKNTISDVLEYDHNLQCVETQF